MTTPVSISSKPSCADPVDLNELSVEAARQRILQSVTAVECPQKVALRSALGTVLARDMLSAIDVPACASSAMDGYAVPGRDLPDHGIQTLRVIGTAWAGTPFTGAVNPGEAVRIMTGAVIPDGCDAVIMQEQVECEGDQLRIGAGHRPGENIRRAGEDLAKGQIALAKGHRLQPADLGLLASLGIVPKSAFNDRCASLFSLPAVDCSASVSRCKAVRSMTATATPCLACSPGWAWTSSTWRGS